MPRITPDQPLQPSILDRLLDDDPSVTRDPPRNRFQVLRELKRSVRRDLEDLLNARQRCRPVPPELKELQDSLASYGLPDVAGAQFGSPEGRERFRELLENVMFHWEPRFKTVKVTLLEGADATDRAMRFRIDALLRADPAPEPVIFDSAIEPTTGGVKVEGVE